MTNPVPGRPVRLAPDVSGVATVEYVILLMLIAVVSIGAWASLGKTVKAQIECAADALEDDEVHCASGQKPDNGPSISPAPADNSVPVSPAAGNAYSAAASQDSAKSAGANPSPAGTTQSTNPPNSGSNADSNTPASNPLSGTSTSQPSSALGTDSTPKPKK